MLAEKVIKMATQLIILILFARFLGPNDMGQLLYCVGLTSIFICLNNFGLDTVLVKLLIEGKEKKYKILQSSISIRFIASFLCFLCINIVGFFIVDSSSSMLLLIISLSHFFMPLTIYEYYFQAEGRSDLSAVGLICGHITGFVFRLFVLYYDGGLIWLGISYSIDYLVTIFCYLFLFKKPVIKNFLYDLKDYQPKINIIQEAFPLMLSGAVVTLYMKIDQIMIGSMLGVNEVAIYVSGSRLSEAWYFFGITIISVYFPKLLVTLKEKGQLAFEGEVIKLGKTLFYISIILAIIVCVLSDFIVVFLYGSEFLNSSNILKITIWSVPFVYLGAISTRMYILENKQKMVFNRSLIGLIINVLLNSILIPIYGVLGAAMATLISQLFASYLANYIIGGSYIFKTQTKIIAPVFFKKG